MSALHVPRRSRREREARRLARRFPGDAGGRSASWLEAARDARLGRRAARALLRYWLAIRAGEVRRTAAHGEERACSTRR